MFQFLGHNFDLADDICVPKTGSVQRLLEGVHKLFVNDRLKLNVVQKIQGKLNSISTNVLSCMLIRAIGNLTCGIPSDQGDAWVTITPEVQHLILMWLHHTKDLQRDGSFKLFETDSKTLSLRSVATVVSDASDYEVGSFSFKYETSSAQLDPISLEVEKQWSFVLPPEIPNLDSTCRELFGLLLTLQQAEKDGLFEDAETIQMFCDSRAAIWILCRCKSRKREALHLAHKVLTFLINLKKPFQFSWKRRDHRMIEYADFLSKQYHVENPLLEEFIQRFTAFDSFVYLPIHLAFQVSVETDLASWLIESEVNFLVLPYHSSLLEIWISFLLKTTDFRWVAVVPQLFCSPKTTKFLAKFRKQQVQYTDVLQNPRFLVSKNAWICSNTSFSYQK